MKLASLTVNPAKIEAGEWIENLPECGDLKIKTKGLNNAAYRAMQAKLIAAVPRAERRSGLTPETLRKINTTLLVETCLLDWANLEGEAFSKERALEILADPQYEPLLNACTVAASWVGDERSEDVEEAVKN